LISLFEELVVDVSYVMMLGKSGIFLEPVGLITHQRQLLGQLTKVVKFHAKQFLPNSRQHPCNSHISQLIIWQSQGEAHAHDFP
jgi:hypothetical protein